MDRSNKGNGDRRLFGMLRSGRKPKTGAGQKAVDVIPGIAESIPANSTHPSSTSSPPVSHAPKVAETHEVAPQAPEATDTREQVISSSSSDIVPGPGAASFTLPTASTQLDNSGDRERTENRYRKAMEQLQKSIKLPRKSWEAFAIPDFKD